MAYHVSPFTYQGRGEPNPIWLHDDSNWEEHELETLDHIIESLRNTRKIINQCLVEDQRE